MSEIVPATKINPAPSMISFQGGSDLQTFIVQRNDIWKQINFPIQILSDGILAAVRHQGGMLSPERIRRGRDPLPSFALKHRNDWHWLKQMTYIQNCRQYLLKQSHCPSKFLQRNNSFFSLDLYQLIILMEGKKKTHSEGESQDLRTTCLN